MIRLSGHPEDWKTTYQAARPWPHLILDDVVTPDVAGEIVTEATGAPSSLFFRESSRRVRKDAVPDGRSLGATVERLFEELADQPFLDFLTEVTGVGGLLADDSLYSAGVFITRPGGWQRVHEDFPRHPVTRLWNRVAVLLYCCEWSGGWGGELELWPRDMSRRGKTIQPAPGRLVVFDTHGGTRHGVAEVAAAALPRVVVATRYYSAEPPPIRSSRGLRRSFRRPTEHRRDIRPTLSEWRDYVYGHRHGHRRGERPIGR